VSAAIVAAGLFALLPQDPEAAAPEPIALVPDPIAVARAFAPVEIDLDFTLGEEERSRLKIELAEQPGKDSRDERCTFVLDFDPFEGARCTWSRIAKDVPLEGAVLARIPEPKGLRYELRLTLFAGQGAELAFRDGFPIFTATTPVATDVTISFETSGAVMGLIASAPRAAGVPERAAGNPDWEDALAMMGQISRHKGVEPEFESQPVWATWMPVIVSEESRARIEPHEGPSGGQSGDLAERFDDYLEIWIDDGPSSLVARQIDEVEVPEGTLRRFALEPLELVQIPALVLEPPRCDGGRGVLLVAGGPMGKSDPTFLAQVAGYAQSNALVVAVEILGVGERHELQPHDDLDSLESRLLGADAAALELDLLRSIARWMAELDGVARDKIEVLLDPFAADSVAAIDPMPFTPFERRKTAAYRFESPHSPSRELSGSSGFGALQLRQRFDSWLLAAIPALRDECALPDRSRNLVERIRPDADARGRLAALPHGHAHSHLSILFFDSVDPVVAADGHTDPIWVSGSDLGTGTALRRAAERFQSAIGTLLHFDSGFLPENRGLHADGSKGIAELADSVWADLAEREVRGRVVAPRMHLFGEGSFGVLFLVMAALHPERVESVTALHCIPSFETLLDRPYDVERGAPSLGLLTQGWPAWMYEHGVLTRYDLEDCVLYLRERGVKVEWLEPVDALRRPLSRHDRLAMWPRVKRLESVR
jgi:hypothetical protein